MDLIPSRLASWVFWRNAFTDRNPDAEPFGHLKSIIGLESSIVTSKDWEDAHGGECPLCHGDRTVALDDTALYCVCEILDWQISDSIKRQSIRTKVSGAMLSEIKYPDALKGVGRKSLKDAVKATEDFIRKPFNWLIFHGTYGSGKTHLLRSINRSLFPIAVYVAARDVEDMTHAYRKEDDMQLLYELMRYAPVLLIDDLGMEYGGPLVRSMIDRIIDARYERWPDYPVVIATNLTTTELKDYLPRTGDRLQDLAKVNVQSLKEVTSYRKVHPSLR